jgi:hypothetical protein
MSEEVLVEEHGTIVVEVEDRPFVAFHYVKRNKDATIFVASDGEILRLLVAEGYGALEIYSSEKLRKVKKE